MGAVFAGGAQFAPSAPIYGNISFPGWQDANFSTPEGIRAAYNNAGSNAASVNQQNHANILAGYQQFRAQQQAGWNQLQSHVQDLYKGANRANIVDINKKAEASFGKGQAFLISSGLGTSSQQNNYRTQVMGTAAQEATRSRGEFAKLRGGAYERIGSSALASDQTTALSQLNWMNSLDAPYPDPGLYASLARAYGGAAGGLAGGGGAGGIYPAMQGIHKFASDVTPMTYEPGGGGGYASLADTYGFVPQQPAYNNPVQSAAGVGYEGQYYPSYATSPQYSWTPDASSYGRQEATY